jgi:transglutaminase/protease-like cytokinesis protein 3
MRILGFLILFGVSFFCFSQENSLADEREFIIPDSISENPISLAKHMRAEYSNDNDYVRELYLWTINNIVYTENIIDTFQDEDLVFYALKSKTGKCKNYSAVITSLCQLVGIEAYSVLGYVQVDGEIQTDRDHAWNIVKIDSTYYLFDPTWDSQNWGYNYYKKNGKDFIVDHMPYDPMMQLLNFPITHTQFFQEIEKGDQYFNYKSEFEEYKNLSPQEQLKKMLSRAESNGIVINELAFLYPILQYFVNKHTR